MGVAERDPHTGYLTTGHEWNGITELNTPVPRAIYVFLVAAVLFSVGYWILMPAWPIGVTYTKGLLGIDQRASVRESLHEAARERSVWASRIMNGSYTAILADPALMTIARAGGRTLFRDNCAVCHGAEARGGPGFPSLTAGSAIWGRDPDAIAETIRVGVNSGHAESRSSQMPAFGRDGMLARKEIAAVAHYVRTLSGGSDGAADVEAGKSVFAANCAACHGEDGKGNPEVGAPDLSDRTWIYGGDASSVYRTIWGGRQGRMPSWEQRLSPLERKMLTLYLIDLRGGDR